jgi:Predicted nucleic-acid-binding protein containing a Zn-ribbon
MSLIERITKLGDAKVWHDDMPIESLYTVGIAGEKFLRAIKDQGVIMGAVCPECNLTYVPPMMYCERCFAEPEEWVDVGTEGTVYTYTILGVSLETAPWRNPRYWPSLRWRAFMAV